MTNYSRFADSLLVAVYDRCGRTPQKPCHLQTTIADYGLEEDGDWLGAVTDEFKRKGYWIVEIGNGPSVLLTAEGIRRAEELREWQDENTNLFPVPPATPRGFWPRGVNWTKWGAIACIIAIPVAIFCAWYFR